MRFKSLQKNENKTNFILDKEEFARYIYAINFFNHIKYYNF